MVLLQCRAHHFFSQWCGVNSYYTCHIEKNQFIFKLEWNHYIMWLLWLFQFSSVQSISRVRLFATPCTTACQAYLYITSSWSSPKFMTIESVMPSSHLILCHPLLRLPPIPPSIRAFSNESTLRMRWPNYWSFSFSTSPSYGYSGLVSFRIDRLALLAVKGTRKILL